MAWASRQPGWAMGFLDEVWWSRFALPRMHAWQDEDQPMHLVEQSWQKGDPDPKAFACSGVLWQQGPTCDPIRKELSLRHGSSGECHHHPISGVVLHRVASPRQDGLAADLG